MSAFRSTFCYSFVNKKILYVRDTFRGGNQVKRGARMRGRGSPHRAPRVRLELRPVTALALSKKPTSQEHSQLLFLLPVANSNMRDQRHRTTFVRSTSSASRRLVHLPRCKSLKCDPYWET
jgi:hypothetical protein